MQRVVIFAASLLAATSLFPHGVGGCPSRESLRPCTCERSDDDDPESSSYVTCAGLDNEQDLANAASSLRKRDHVYSFSIVDSTFTFIPSDAFKGARFVELEIKSSTLMALTDTDIAFAGLENHLEIFLMTESTLLGAWDWSIFRNLNKLMRFDIVRGNLDSIEDLEHHNLSDTLSNINFDNNVISYIHLRAFASFSDLRMLGLSGNDIAEVRRSMLPNPALVLHYIDLSYNRLERLPNDLFSEMPSLAQVAVAGNKLLVLREEVFGAIWEQLDMFTAIGNQLRCDCRMSWMLEKKSPQPLRAICYQPPQLKGKNVADLSSKDLWCY